MPELPEVETIRTQLAQEIVGYKITSLWTDSPKQLKPSAVEFEKGVVGKKISAVGRRAKLLIFDLGSQADNSKNCYFVVHLRLTGRLLVRAFGDPPDKYVHVKMGLESQVSDLKINKVRDLNVSLPISNLQSPTSKAELRFSDARKFGYFQFIKDKLGLQELLDSYGPEPLIGLSLKKFQQILRSTSRKIKEVLMDQKRLAGIGNIYANDALWLAGIHPERRASLLTLQESQRLFNAVLQVLKEGLEQGGASDQWYRQIHGEKGQYQKHFKVYGRKGQPCLRHPQEKIKYLKVGQRGTFYCPQCQKLTLSENGRLKAEG